MNFVVKNEVNFAGVAKMVKFGYTENGTARLRLKLEMPVIINEKQVTDSVWCVAWGDLADQFAALAEGANISVTGRLNGPRSFEKKVNGQPVMVNNVPLKEWISEIRCAEITIL